MNYLRLVVNHYFKFLLLLLLFFLLTQFNASAADVTVAWDANSESNLAGYKFFYGTSNGSISPAGSVTVNNGADQSFTIIPNQNYRVADVVVNGSSIGSVTTNTFDNYLVIAI